MKLDFFSLNTPFKMLKTNEDDLLKNFYATDPKNIGNFEVTNKSATCGPVAANTSKVKTILLYTITINVLLSLGERLKRRRQKDG